MQRRYPGRYGERSGPPERHERDERAYRGAGERGIPDDPTRWPEEDHESAYRRFASEDVGPEDWGSEWTERAARPAGQSRGTGARDPSRFGSDAERDALRQRRGPKGYTRSDERIREDVCERLAHALDIDVSDVAVQVNDGCVQLDGTVPARWMKHDIEDLTDGCLGVRDVENRVRVRRDGEHDAGTVLHPDQRTVTPTLPAARDPEPGTVSRDRERKPHH